MVTVTRERIAHGGRIKEQLIILQKLLEPRVHFTYSGELLFSEKRTEPTISRWNLLKVPAPLIENFRYDERNNAYLWNIYGTNNREKRSDRE